LNVAVFRLLKLGWTTAILEWHRQNPGEIVSLLSWIELEETIECSAINCDQTCGFCPWNPENTDS